MIKKLQIKFVLIVMSVVTLIFLAIFFTMFATIQKNTERMSTSILHQVLNVQDSPDTDRPLNSNNPNPQSQTLPNTRQPVLIMDISKDHGVSIVMNQLHFIEDADMKLLAQLILEEGKDSGVLKSYDLRYLQKDSKEGVRAAFIDISVEREMLQTQIINSLSVGSSALIVFFFLSIFLARWATRPVETVWKRQKQFVANASHELKTPLTVILSNADILRKKETLKDEKDVHRLEHIHAEAIRMKQLVEDMLTLAKYDNSNILDVCDVVDFSYIIKSAVLVYEPILYDHKKMISYDIEEGIFIMGDMTRLQQVAHILLDNAQKYSPQGGIIHVSLEKAESHTLLLTVSNTGEPIPQSELQNIFLRFYRRDESRSEHGSFGLGLSIAQSIINEHKGKIWAKSDEKFGNYFYISLPIL